MYRHIFIPTKVVWDGISQKTWIGRALDLQSKNARNTLQTYLNKLFQRNEAVSQSSPLFTSSPTTLQHVQRFIFGSRVSIRQMLWPFSHSRMSYEKVILFPFFCWFHLSSTTINFISPAFAVAEYCVRVHISVCLRQRAIIMTSVVVRWRRGEGGVCVKRHADNI